MLIIGQGKESKKNKWEDWVKWANNADFNVVLIPLRDEYRNKLDIEKAWSWFENEMEGVPYGFPNFVFTWIDTTNTSFPFITTNDFEDIFYGVLNIFYKELGDLFGIEAFNFRLNTTGLNFQQVMAEAARRGMTLQDLMAIPEKRDGLILLELPIHVPVLLSRSGSMVECLEIWRFYLMNLPREIYIL